MNMKPSSQNARSYLVMLSTLLLTACGADDTVGTGSLTVLVEAEDTITDGIEAGDGIENIRDGWAITYDKFIVTIGDITLHLSTDASQSSRASQLFVVDLTQVPASGLPLWTLDDLADARWDFRFATPTASTSSVKHKSVTTQDFEMMVDEQWTYFIDGAIESQQGQSCPPASIATPFERSPNGNMSATNPCYDANTITFRFGAKANTKYGPCEIDGVPGVAIAADSNQTVAITLHGDHIVFNGFPEGGEGGVTRLAQWLADCDLNLDGDVTMSELKAIAPSDLPELDDRYQLGGSPITPLGSMYDYVRSQLKTQGHFQGEGECPIK